MCCWIRSIKTNTISFASTNTLNPVPCYIYDAGGTANLRLVETAEPLGISSLAATVIKCLGFEPPADYDQAIVDVG